MDQSATPHERAFKACEFGDTPFFQQAVTEGVEKIKGLIAARNDDGRSLIHVAAAGGRTEILQTLIEAVVSSGLDLSRSLSTSDDEGWTPLLSASSSGQVECVTALLAAGVPVGAANSGGRTALHYASSKGHTAISEMLLDKGASIHARDKVGCSPLHRAASAGHVAVCNLLLDRGATVEATDRTGQTPLMMAAQCGHEEVAHLLLERGASVETRDKEGETALTLCLSIELRQRIKEFAESKRAGSARMDVDH